MNLDRQSAAASLADIDSAEQSTFKAVFYGRSGATLILWGIVVAAGYVATQFFPVYASLVWLLAWTTGFCGMLSLQRQRKPFVIPAYHNLQTRLILAQLVLIAFAFAILAVLGPVSGRQMNAFWPLVFMLGYTLAGIWVGAFFIICAIVVTALTFTGYWLAGPWFPLWMAAANGGALILGGLYLRRIGVRA